MQFTMILALVSFLGTGVYNLYKVKNNDTQLNLYKTNIVKFCNRDNLTIEEKNDCMKIFVPQQ